jgi:cytidylate kinase
VLLTIAGPIGSGKSTLARALGDEIRVRAVGFGDYVRHLKREAGASENRRALQD